ncbi:MCM5 [Bugula neritina]|uniref:DNA replication licensing factor MCM5 n=1 Tax=Bugula neritina TaxID=10212 RepID=A0A7J7KMV5_BUGNE|nr:MCM5 [Bugula neritina]
MDPGFDDAGIFFSDNLGDNDMIADLNNTRQLFKRKFKQFIRSFYTGNFVYTYRDTLRRHYNLGCNYLEVAVNDVASFDSELAEQLLKSPSEYIPIFEDATKEALFEIIQGKPNEGDDTIPDIQLIIKSQSNTTNIRELKSEQMSDLIKVSGIIIAASSIKSKATRICLQCRGCRTTLNNIPIRPGLEGYALPRKCNTEQAGRPACPLDPYFIVPDKCRCVDFQVLKLQESPDSVPNGELPRHLTLYVDRELCDKTVPGNKVTVTGIYAIKKAAKSKSERNGPKVNTTRWLTRRGDVNVLMLGDPGTAKSQLLKFVEQAAPIAVYTSGKGSSAAGLTASVMRDSLSFSSMLGFVEKLCIGRRGYGAGRWGVVCIDEFDKMREDDRVAIHEAMEQQTISIAKVGRYERADNIDFMPTILSRFDMIYIVKDEHNEHRDKKFSEQSVSKVLYLMLRRGRFSTVCRGRCCID